MKETYEIVRFRFNGPESIIKTGLTLEQAQAHCKDPETSSRTATNPKEPGVWFDGYREERDRRRPDYDPHR